MMNFEDSNTARLYMPGEVIMEIARSYQSVSTPNQNGLRSGLRIGEMELDSNRVHGLRIGEMERDPISVHDISEFLNHFSMSNNKFIFNIHTHNIFDILNEIHLHPNISFSFKIIDGKNISYGPGANRFVFDLVLRQLTLEPFNLLIKHNNYFVSVNYSNIFWESAENIKTFAKLILMAQQNNVYLPFHFDPILLELISGVSMNIASGLYFLKYYDPEIYTNIVKIDDEYIEENTQCKTKLEYVKTIFSKNHNDKINKLIKDNFKYTTDTDSIIALDKKISGQYIISASDVLSAIKISDDKYLEQWTTFINKLNSLELEKLLLLIGNTTDLSESYTIIIKSDMDVDINITTCSHSIAINEKIFNSESGLDILKIYLIGGQDKMSDRVIFDV